MPHTKPSKHQRTLWMSMARLVRHLSHGANQAVERTPTGINLSQMTVLGQIRALGGSARMVDLAEHLQVTRAAITKIADSLEGQGRLARRPDTGDRRVIRVHLTESGRTALRIAEEAFESYMMSTLWASVSPRDTATAATILSRIEEALELRRGGVLP